MARRKSQTISVGEDMEKLEPSHTAGGNVKQCLETVWQFLKCFNIELPCDPAISHLGIYPREKKTSTQKLVHRRGP